MTEKKVEYKVGVKHDKDKLRWGLVPWESMMPIVRVMMLGAKKYGDFNWHNVQPSRQRYFDAAMRHLIQWWKTGDKDEESGETHLAHAVCCLLFLIWHEDNGQGER